MTRSSGDCLANLPPLPPPVRGLIISGRSVICWSRGRNNNAGNVSPKNRWGIRENALRDFRGELDLWTERGPVSFVPRSFQAMGKFVMGEEGEEERCVDEF